MNLKRLKWRVYGKWASHVESAVIDGVSLIMHEQSKQVEMHQ